MPQCDCTSKLVQPNSSGFKIDLTIKTLALYIDLVAQQVKTKSIHMWLLSQLDDCSIRVYGFMVSNFIIPILAEPVHASYVSVYCWSQCLHFHLYLPHIESPIQHGLSCSNNG